MKKFLVPFKMEAYGSLLVPAETEAEAKEMLSNVTCSDWDQDFSRWSLAAHGEPILDTETEQQYTGSETLQ
jgi:hypothetical protein